MKLPGIGGAIHNKIKKKRKKKKAKRAAEQAQRAQQAQQIQQFQQQMGMRGCLHPRLQDPARAYFANAQSAAQVDGLNTALQQNLLSSGRFSANMGYHLNQVADQRKMQLAYGMP
jgi:hypothetical protein